MQWLSVWDVLEICAFSRDLTFSLHKAHQHENLKNFKHTCTDSDPRVNVKNGLGKHFMSYMGVLFM